METGSKSVITYKLEHTPTHALHPQSAHFSTLTFCASYLTPEDINSIYGTVGNHRHSYCQVRAGIIEDSSCCSVSRQSFNYLLIKRNPLAAVTLLV